MAQHWRVIPKTFFGELRRRNVYKVAVAYAVVAWLKDPKRAGATNRLQIIPMGFFVEA